MNYGNEKMSITEIRNQDIIFFSTCDWDGLWYQKQHLAHQFALHGFNVYYFNRTLQRWPTINHLATRLSVRKSGIKSIEIPKNIKVITPFAGPPLKKLRFLNRRLLKRSIANYSFKKSIFICYNPTYNALDLIDIIKPARIAYVNDHNYDAMNVIPALLESEKQLINRSDILFADSQFNRDRLSKLSKGKTVYPSLPGVFQDVFCSAYRGNETIRCENLYYFGLVEDYLDINLYNELSAKFNVTFIGSVASSTKTRLSEKIRIHPPVSNEELPALLQEADMLGLFYLDSPYIRGVLPAKFFESIATRKPLLVSGLREADPYLDIVYDVKGSPEIAMKIISRLGSTECEGKLLKKAKISKEADWSNRFTDFLNFLNDIQ